MQRDYYKIAIIAASGSGKTYSFRNMNPETTGFINVENKPLPFKNNFKYHTRIKTHNEVLNTMAEYAKNPEINCIVIDSFSAYVDLVLEEARRTKKGFDIWNMYAEEIGKFFKYFKALPKEAFFTAHYEILGIEGSQEKRIKVKGREWEGVVEKELTIVLYADKSFNDGKADYYFLTAGEGLSAKCPPDLIGEVKIPNDSNEVYNKILKYVN